MAHGIKKKKKTEENKGKFLRSLIPNTTSVLTCKISFVICWLRDCKGE